MIELLALIVLSVVALYAIGQINGTTPAFASGVARGFKNVASVGAGYRPVEHIRG